jgi:hypothetical protein
MKANLKWFFVFVLASVFFSSAFGQAPVSVNDSPFLLLSLVLLGVHSYGILQFIVLSVFLFSFSSLNASRFQKVIRSTLLALIVSVIAQGTLFFLIANAITITSPGLSYPSMITPHFEQIALLLGVAAIATFIIILKSDWFIGIHRTSDRLVFLGVCYLMFLVPNTILLLDISSNQSAGAGIRGLVVLHMSFYSIIFFVSLLKLFLGKKIIDALKE